MKTMMDELKNISVRKHVHTSVEYDCKTEDKEEEVFDMVRDIVIDHLDEIAKITYDIEPGHKVKVEVSQSM